MPLEIQYGPAGLLAGLAVNAGAGEGQAEGQRFAADYGLRLQELSLRREQIAREQSTRLQEAYASRTAAAQQRTPAADHIAEAAGVKNQDQAIAQKQFKGVIDQMLAKGQLSAENYQKAMIAYLTGNHTMMATLMANPKAEKTNLSNAEELSVIREPFQAKRRELQSAFTTSMKNEFDDKVREQKEADLHKALNQSMTDEMNAVQERFGPGGRGAPAPKAEPVPAGSAGSGSVTNLQTGLQSVATPGGAMVTAPASRMQNLLQQIGQVQGPMRGPQQAPLLPGIAEGATIVNDRTGEKRIFRDGQWMPLPQQESQPMLDMSGAVTGTGGQG